MRFFRYVFFFLLACCSMPQYGADQFVHLGNAGNQPMVECAEHLFGKRVLWQLHTPLNKAGACPASRGELLQNFKANSISVMEEQNWAFLLPSSFLPPWPDYADEGAKIHWKRFRVEVSAESADLQERQNEVKLERAQLDRLKDQVLAQTRLIPVSEPHTEFADGVAVIPLKLEFYVRRTRKNGPRTLVVVLRENNNDVPGRLIYGEETENGAFRLLWDSPILLARYMSLGFQDVDNDGVEEIVIESAYPAGIHDLDALTIFTINGKEIARALPCSVPDLYGYSAADGACPIVGDQVQLDYSTPPPYKILVDRWITDNTSVEFKFLNGKYSRVVARR